MHRSESHRKALTRGHLVLRACLEPPRVCSCRPPQIFSAVDQPIVTEVNESQSATIRFAVGECSLGSILVAASEKGVCAIFLGNNPDALVKDLQDRFPKARSIEGDSDFTGGAFVLTEQRPRIQSRAEVVGLK
jgi:AraC family transcriptional regulator, regulatory protein of adaptative response / methylated-DNA-[protein]-cysteine methyltransferase